eukprot:19820_1
MANATSKQNLHGLDAKLYKEYHQNGFIVKRKLFDSDEINILCETIAKDRLLQSNKYELKDITGRKTPRTIWNYLNNDTYGNFLQSERIINTVKLLLNVKHDRDISHYHSKINMKIAKTGSAFVWHQDYGYWYDYGLLYPYLCTVFIAIDECNKANGCLQVLKSSHLMGRIEHKIQEGTGQKTIDKQRLEWIKNVCDREYVELNRGDVIFLHCNTLHSSDANHSSFPRYALIGCYNKTNNKIYKKHQH